MNRLQQSLRRKRAIERVAEEEFELTYRKGGRRWDTIQQFSRDAAISLTTSTVERYERALTDEEPASKDTREEGAR